MVIECRHPDGSGAARYGRDCADASPSRRSPSAGVVARSTAGGCHRRDCKSGSRLPPDAPWVHALPGHQAFWRLSRRAAAATTSIRGIGVGSTQSFGCVGCFMLSSDGATAARTRNAARHRTVHLTVLPRPRRNELRTKVPSLGQEHPTKPFTACFARRYASSRGQPYGDRDISNCASPVTVAALLVRSESPLSERRPSMMYK